MRRFEQEAEEEQETGNRFLTFTVGQDNYALAIDYVSEIVRLQPIVPIPQQRAYMKGVMNLRGRIIPVIDLRRRLRDVDIEPTERTCIIVTEVGGDAAGLMVDTVSEMADIPQADISVMEGDADGCICGLAHSGDTVRMVLDCGAVLGQGRFDSFDLPSLKD